MKDIYRRPSSFVGRISAFHIAVVSLSLLLTVSAWQFAKFQVETRTGQRFEAARDQALGLISDRMAKYEDALWAGVAAVESHGGDISYESWRTFADNLRIDRRYPGINGIGVIHAHTAETLGDYLSLQRNERPDFTVYPEHDQPIFMPITFIEPEAINAKAIGLDVAHELNRRTAALASRDSGTAQITGPIVLVQDAGQTPGFLFYAPFYDGGRPAAVTDRRNNFLGAVYAPFVMHRLMEGLLAKELRHVRFSIKDGETVLYDEHQENQDQSNDPTPMFSEQIYLEIYGRTWVIDMRTNLNFRAENTYSQPTVILLAGLLIEALIIALLFLMARANRRAVEYADKVTLALKHEQFKLLKTNQKLSNKNEELESFAYIASHDLKTPIRGISGLAEMVKEDLVDYFKSDDSNPEVAANLIRIQARAARMEQLTNGILQIARVDAAQKDLPAVGLLEMVHDLGFDLGLNGNQLTFQGGDVDIDVDPLNLRGVLENLVGNAVKYHHNSSELRVKITADICDTSLLISVSDNGPGIHPRFHERIFEVFQTLRSATDAESTGIGLTIVKKAVERHGGSVTVSSNSGAGATFSFDWPIATLDFSGGSATAAA